MTCKTFFDYEKGNNQDDLTRNLNCLFMFLFVSEQLRLVLVLQPKTYPKLRGVPPKKNDGFHYVVFPIGGYVFKLIWKKSKTQVHQKMFSTFSKKKLKNVSTIEKTKILMNSKKMSVER